MAADVEKLAKLDVTPREARILQQQIAPLIEHRDRFGTVRTVAGADIALQEKTGYAAFIVYSFPKLEEIEGVSSEGELKFPYVPGLLSFREIPLLLQAFAKLQTRPDLILVDAHGWAHPRRAGMACHLGLLLDLPTIGCAKSVLIGEYKMPASKRGSTSPLLDGDDQIGVALRMRDAVSPVFVSVGHRVSLASAVKLVLACTDGYRIPKPQREADHWVKTLKPR